MDGNVTTAFAIIRAQCLLGSVILCLLERSTRVDSNPINSSHPAKLIATRCRIETILTNLPWEYLFNHMRTETSVCDGVSTARLLAILACRVSPKLQSMLCKSWATDALIQLAYSGISDENARKNNKIGYFTGAVSRWYPIEEMGSWQRRVASLESIEVIVSKMIILYIMNHCLCCYVNKIILLLIL